MNRVENNEYSGAGKPYVEESIQLGTVGRRWLRQAQCAQGCARVSRAVNEGTGIIGRKRYMYE